MYLFFKFLGCPVPMPLGGLTFKTVKNQNKMVSSEEEEQPTLCFISFSKILNLLCSLLQNQQHFLRLLIFLPTILIPISTSSNPTFLMVYFVVKFNKKAKV